MPSKICWFINICSSLVWKARFLTNPYILLVHLSILWGESQTQIDEDWQQIRPLISASNIHPICTVQLEHWTVLKYYEIILYLNQHKNCGIIFHKFFTGSSCKLVLVTLTDQCKGLSTCCDRYNKWWNRRTRQIYSSPLS